MSRRLLALAAVALVVLGAAVGVWASRTEHGPAKPACTQTTFAVPDPTTGKVMTYHGDSCAERP